MVLDHPAPPKPFRRRRHPGHGGLYHPHQRLREERRDGEGVELRLRASRERPWQQHIGVFENEVPGIPKIEWLITVDSGLSMLNVDGYLFLFKSCSKYHFEANQFFHTPTCQQARGLPFLAKAAQHLEMAKSFGLVPHQELEDVMISLQVNCHEYL